MTASGGIAVKRGSIGAGVLWMSALALLLFWLPVVGPLVAGYVGGRKAGSAARALVAAIVPGLILTVLVGFLSTMLSGLPLIGILAGFGTLILLTGNIGPMLLGALLGGFMA
ncbi:MAG: hypothetical protein ABI765_17000 [Gemmatimonadota bacterium]